MAEVFGFGMGGLVPHRCSDGALEIAVTMSELLDARSALDEAKNNVPEYTGQWEDKDYYANELEAYYRAAERYAIAVSSYR